MAREIVMNPQTKHDKLAAQSPEFVTLAMRAINKWKPGEDYLVTIIAEALQEAYRRGEAGEPALPLPPRTRTRPAAPQRVRRTRR